MGLDLELQDEVAGCRGEQVGEEQRGLGGRAAVAVAQPRAPQLARRALVREALEVRAERQVRVVEQDERAVGGEADVGLEAVDARR